VIELTNGKWTLDDLAAGVDLVVGIDLKTKEGKAKVAKEAKKIYGEVFGVNKGRSGKQARLRELANDPKLGKADKGWIKQGLNQINRGKRKNIRLPGSSKKREKGEKKYGGAGGKELAHKRGYEADKGYGYEYSNLQDKKLHKLQHKYDDKGRKNKDRGKNEN